MPDQRSSVESEANACLDKAVLELILHPDRQRPWSEAEIARTINTPGNVPASLKRLRIAGLVHRWNDLATASHPAVRFHEITQSPKDPASARKRHWDKVVLESLLVRDRDGRGPLSQQDLRCALGAMKKKQKLAITEAINRLDGAGLIECRAGRAIVSEVAKSFDQIMTVSHRRVSDRVELNRHQHEHGV
jgi:hypothetical protein